MSGKFTYLCQKQILVTHLILVFFFSPTGISAQNKIPMIPKDDVGFPLPYYSPVTGTFAEIRNHNLHLGSDFKSYGLNGHSILATFDGYVEEVSYSKTGYGLSLNLLNPKFKIKSKYAHLHSFGGQLPSLELLRKALFLMGEKEGFSLKLPVGMFNTKKGTPIGKTGESGSGISHLHLEFRTETGIVNPLFFPDLHQRDSTPPTILSILIECDALDKPLQLKAKEVAVGVFQLIDESGNEIESIQVSGKVKVRISGYDIIRSRNKNNVYGMDLFFNDKEIFSRNFDFLSYENGTKKHQYYDVNRSSFSPPIYFYHLYDQPKNWKDEGYSFDLTPENNKSIHKLEAGLLDATGNRSYVRLMIKNEPTIQKQTSADIIFGKKVFSKDKIIFFDVSKNQSSGQGSIIIDEIQDLQTLPFQFPKNMTLKSKVYFLHANNYSWQGDGEGGMDQRITPGTREAMYYVDASTRKFTSISQKKKSNGFQFFLSKFGYLMVLEDWSPPIVSPMTSLARHIELPEIRNHCFEERYYAVNDTGSGFKNNVEVSIDGQTFPYDYDPDRSAIKVSLPKSLHKEKPYLLIEVRAFDLAGNKSDPFLDLISTSGWKKEFYASCPLIE